MEQMNKRDALKWFEEHIVTNIKTVDISAAIRENGTISIDFADGDEWATAAFEPYKIGEFSHQSYYAYSRDEEAALSYPTKNEFLELGLIEIMEHDPIVYGANEKILSLCPEALGILSDKAKEAFSQFIAQKAESIAKAVELVLANEYIEKVFQYLPHGSANEYSTYLVSGKIDSDEQAVEYFDVDYTKSKAGILDLDKYKQEIEDYFIWKYTKE